MKQDITSENFFRLLGFHVAAEKKVVAMIRHRSIQVAELAIGIPLVALAVAIASSQK